MAADWPTFVDTTCGREPREWLTNTLSSIAVDRSASVRPHAIDLGCGAGNDTLAMLAHGFGVTAVDITPSAIATTRARAEEAGYGDALHAAVASFRAVQIPVSSVELIHAGFSLPFADPDHFDELWRGLFDGLRPGGYFVGQLFGDRDEWATPDADIANLFHRRDEVDRLTERYDVVELEEVERQGQIADGTPKYWHVYHLRLRRPGS